MVRRKKTTGTPGPVAAPSKPIPKRSREEFEGDTSENESQEGSVNEFEEGSSQDGQSEDEELDSEGGFEEEDADPDAPRLVQWDDDDELDYEGAKPEKAAKVKASNLIDLEDNLKRLPLGTLRKAQSALYQAEVETDSDSEGSDDGSDSDVSERPTKPKKEKVEWTSKETRKKRANKNAPMEITSKKPVTWHRTVIETPKIVARDPRFLPTAGEFKPEAFQKSYGFLTDAHKTELQTLRDNLKTARRLLSSSPRDLREEREAEVQRLENAMKRAESMVNKDRQESIQRDAVARAKLQEKQKRQDGKGAWYMKKGEKRELLNKARFEAIAAQGGARAVKKTIEKKQKKIAQKEKKSRPYAKGSFDKADNPRRFSGNASSGDSRPKKRFRPS